MTFAHAVESLKGGQAKKIFRAGWNGKNMWVSLQVPTADSFMTLPYLYMEYPVGHVAYPQGCRVPWLASQTDILADDWSSSL